MKSILLSLSLLIASSAAAQEWAKSKIESSPRHHEWVKVKHGDREVNCYVTYPEVKDKATAVIVIHEIFGLTDWARSVTDELAKSGYIAIEPDLLSGMAPGGGGTAEMGGQDNATRAVGKLPQDQVTADLDAVAKYVSALPSCNGKIVVGGFCWGGGQSFHYATQNKDLKAAFVFYGTPPSEAEMAKINCPVYGFYGGNDYRVTSTVPKATEQMKAANKTYEPVTYDGAGHGFMRAGEQPEKPAASQKDHDDAVANKKARDEAWTRWKEILKKI